MPMTRKDKKRQEKT